MYQSISGGCLCGEVTFTVSPPFYDFYFCHCTLCRKSGGSSHAANLFCDPGLLDWHSGESLIKTYELGGNRLFNKSFCELCGSALPARAKSGDFFIVPAGCLDQELSVVPSKNIFWSEKAGWYLAGYVAPKYDKHGPALLRP